MLEKVESEIKKEVGKMRRIRESFKAMMNNKQV
jgi:hypothetical protein